MVTYIDGIELERVTLQYITTRRNVYNTEKPMSAKSLIGYLKQNDRKYDVKYSTNISIEHGKSARGFQGVFVKIRTDSN